MGLLDLPVEILYSILEYSTQNITKSQIYSYRLVSRAFEIQVNKLCWKRRCWAVQNSIVIDGCFAHVKQYQYSKGATDEYGIKSIVHDFLLSSKPAENDLQHSLRQAMAILMHSTQPSVQATPDLKFPWAIKDEDGTLQAYEDTEMRTRFLKIADLLTRTVVFVSGPDLNHVIPPTAEDSQLNPLNEWDIQWFQSFYVPNLDWALATVILIGDRTWLETILKDAGCYGQYIFSTTTRLLSDTKHDFDRFYDFTNQGPAWANALAVAIRKGNFELATVLMDYHGHLVNAYTTVPPHESALEIACRQGSLQMVDMILDPNRGLDYVSWHASYAVTKTASHKCHSDGLGSCDERAVIVHTLLGLQSLERDCQKLKDEILLEACKWGCMTLIHTLIEDLGAQVAEFDLMNLACAAIHGHVEVIEYLLGHSTKHFSLLFSVYNIDFEEAAADPEMMEYLEKTDALVLAQGPLEPAKARWLVDQAKKIGLQGVVDLFERGGLRT